MSNARNLADVISGNYDVPAGSLDNVDLTSRVAKSGDTMTGNLIVDANVGIGTSSPSDLLDISASVPEFRLTSTSGPYSLVTSNTVGTLQFMADEDNTGANTSMRFRVDGSERMRIDSAGNVGIGTSSPGYKLDVNGAAAIRAGNLLYSFNSDNTNSTYIYNPGATGAGNGSFLFGIVGQGEQMRLTPAGLGIGTSSPTQKLDVAGTVKATAFVGDGSGLTGISGGVTSLNGETGAITNNVANTIGSYAGAANTGNYSIGNTRAGSDLVYRYFNGSSTTDVSLGLTGTWRHMGGYRRSDTDAKLSSVGSLYVRIS